MKKATFITVLAASLLLVTCYRSAAENYDGAQQDKQPAPVKKTTTATVRTGGGGTGGSHQDTTVVTPVHPVRHRQTIDTMHKVKKMRKVN